MEIQVAILIIIELTACWSFLREPSTHPFKSKLWLHLQPISSGQQDYLVA